MSQPANDFICYWKWSNSWRQLLPYVSPFDTTDLHVCAVWHGISWQEKYQPQSIEQGAWEGSVHCCKKLRTEPSHNRRCVSYCFSVHISWCKHFHKEKYFGPRSKHFSVILTQVDKNSGLVMSEQSKLMASQVFCLLILTNRVLQSVSCFMICKIKSKCFCKIIYQTNHKLFGQMFPN